MMSLENKKARYSHRSELSITFLLLQVTIFLLYLALAVHSGWKLEGGATPSLRRSHLATNSLAPHSLFNSCHCWMFCENELSYRNQTRW